MAKKPETILGEKIVAAFRQRGAFIEKLHGDGEQRRGLPDYVVSFRGTCGFMELKTPTGKLEPAQIQVIAEITKTGGFVEVITSMEEALQALERLGARAEVKMCNPNVAVTEWLAETPEEDRREPRPVSQRRVDGATRALQGLMQVMDKGDILMTLAEIGMIDLVDLNDTGGLRFAATSAQLVALTAALAAVHEEMIATPAPIAFTTVP